MQIGQSDDVAAVGAGTVWIGSIEIEDIGGDGFIDLERELEEIG